MLAHCGALFPSCSSDFCVSSHGSLFLYILSIGLSKALIFFLLSFCFVFETESHALVLFKDDLELLMPLPLPVECWDYGCVCTITSG